MRKGSAKILVLLGLFIFIGLAFVFLAGTGSEKQSSPETARAAKHDVDKDIFETEKQMYMEKMDKFKAMILKLEQKDMKKFKEHTKESFNELAGLIKNLPKLSGKMKSEVKEEVMEVRRSAEKIALLEDEKKVIEQVKKGFDSAKDALEEIKKNLDCDKAVNKDFCDKLKKKIKKIEEKIKQINMQNYKQMTKEIFMDFYLLLKYMHSQMSKPEFMTRVQAGNGEVKTIQVINEEAEQKINKTNKDKNDDNDDNDDDDDDDDDDKDKKSKDKEKCGCQHD